MEEKIHTKAVVDVSRGGLEVILPSGAYDLPWGKVSLEGGWQIRGNYNE